MSQEAQTKAPVELPVQERAVALDDRRRRKGMLFLGLAVAGVGFALAIQMSLNTNFLVGEFQINPRDNGLIEAVRESCGIFAFGVLAVLAGLAEPLVGAAMLVLLGLGLGAYAFAPSWPWVMAMSLVWSQGLHVWMPLPNSIALSLGAPDRAGRRLGQLGAAGAVGSALGLAVGLLVNHYQWAPGLGICRTPLRTMFLFAGAGAFAAAAACLGVPRGLKTPGPRLVLRRRYSLYYILCLLEGWRKQLFICFAYYLLVNNYGVRPEGMLLLAGCVQVIGYFAAPRVGRLVDRAGERKILTSYYACIIGVFVGYMLIPSLSGLNVPFALGGPWGRLDVSPALAVLCVLFVADGALFMCNLATTTYVNRIAPAEDHTPTLSVGVAANHISAVLMPLAGGILWKEWGPQWTFLSGAVAAALSVLAARFVPLRGGREAGSGPTAAIG